VRARRAGFGKPDELGQLRKGHVAANLAVGVEQGFGREAAELEAAAQALYGVAFGVGVALGHAPDALAGDVVGDVCVHFNEDETALAAVFGVLLEHGMTGGAGPGEAVENEGVFVGGDLQDALNQSRWFWSNEKIAGCSQIENLADFLL
jgi:hypothetical protein